MKKQYDFSVAERGKFYRAKAKLNLPVYLDAEVRAFVERTAAGQDTDPSTVVNQLLRTAMQSAPK